jgi:hypothetical protein
MSQLINPVGPEANNQRAEEFEDRVVAWMAALGWDARCRNIDLYANEGDQSKGVDVLAAYDDPQLGHRLGLVTEAKIRHPLRADKTQKELAAVARKLATLAPVIPKLSAAEDIHATRTALLVYDASPYEPAKLADALSTVQPVGTTRGEWPREVWTIGPDTLVGMADAFSRAEPAAFYWPPFERTAGAWTAIAPPHQVGAGVLAWRTSLGKVSLWLRDPLPHDEDFPAISDLVWDWQIDVDRIICSSVTRDHWRTQTSRWASEVKKAANRGIGLLPTTIEARELTWESLTPFVDRWSQEAA